MFLLKEQVVQKTGVVPVVPPRPDVIIIQGALHDPINIASTPLTVKTRAPVEQFNSVCSA